MTALPLLIIVLPKGTLETVAAEERKGGINKSNLFISTLLNS